MDKKTILIVGAGLTGATIARELAETGYNVDVIDSRNHIAGNAYDYTNEYGIRVHKYGPHLFHTNNEDVFNYLSQFTEWAPYQHKVKAMLSDGRLVTLPVNAETKEIVGEENVLDIFFRPYTLKMWDIPLDELNPTIIERVPIRDDMNELYFPKDKFQAMPVDGYTEMVRRMLDHPSIHVYVGESFTKDVEADYDHIFNAMPIDVYYDNCFGELPYRSIKFDTHTIPVPKVFPTATVNFTHDGPNTRVTEWKNIPNHGTNPHYTTLTFETPCDYKENRMERYYPVKDKDGKNRDTYNKYLAIPNKKTTFVGRCGWYAYIDMHQAVNAALKTVQKWQKSL